MSTEAEKMESIAFAVESARRRLEQLKERKAHGQMTRADTFEWDMTIECIHRGEHILKVYRAETRGAK